MGGVVVEGDGLGKADDVVDVDGVSDEGGGGRGGGERPGGQTDRRGPEEPDAVLGVHFEVRDHELNPMLLERNLSDVRNDVLADPLHLTRQHRPPKRRG